VALVQGIPVYFNGLDNSGIMVKSSGKAKRFVSSPKLPD
jgi:hypothetical protein